MKRNLGKINSEQRSDYLQFLELFLQWAAPKIYSTFAIENNHATNYLRNILDSEDVVVFTDRPHRSAYILALDILEGFEKPYVPIVLNKVENQVEITKVLDKITNNSELPHLFYKKHYVGGSREIVLQYESGELEERLDVEPYMELPKMYPDARDYEKAKTQSYATHNYETGFMSDSD